MEDNLKILLCEDDENLGMLLREYLAAKGYEAELCPDGEAGYKAFLKTKFDICVLDVMMPKKDGFTLAQEIRTANAEIPIIFLTAKTLKEDILDGFKIGADDYITKPFVLKPFYAEYAARRTRKVQSTISDASRSTHKSNFSASATSRQSSPPRRTNCWHCSAAMPMRFCNATLPLRQYGLTTTISTHVLWMSTSPNCAST